ncbi:MAG: family 16 glycoside hydrolase [Methyloceanibacter sp.]
MRRVLFLLAVATLFLAGHSDHAAACQGPEVIFEDTFGDETGGWTARDTVEIEDGAFTLKLAPDDMQANLNVTFTVDNADICADAVWPEGEQPVLGAGLLFWGESNQTYFQFGVLNNGRFWIARKQDGKWLGTIAANVDSPAIHKAPGAANTLRVKTEGDKATFFINGTKVRELRGQAPKGPWRFGLSGDNFDKQNEARVIFRTVKVTN